MSNIAASRVLVVDDSALMRRIIGDAITSFDGFTLAGTARDGEDGLKKIKSLKPDAVTMDIQMPNLSGLEALERVMDECPVPVIMVSSLTSRSASVTLDSLNRGAIDYVTKPENAKDIGDGFRTELLSKLRIASAVDVAKLHGLRKRKRPARAVARATTAQTTSSHSGLDDACIVIGISTGGPPVLASLFESLTPPLPPILIVQHMPAQFTGPFSSRLNDHSAFEIKEAQSGDELKAGTVLVAPGGKHMKVRKSGTKVCALVSSGEPVCGHMPSADVAMKSAASLFGDRCLGVIMTGMGYDGADGCGAIREAGGRVIGQNEATSAVYGMNKIAFERGHVEQQFSLTEAPTLITRMARRIAPQLAKA